MVTICFKPVLQDLQSQKSEDTVIENLVQACGKPFAHDNTEVSVACPGLTLVIFPWQIMLLLLSLALSFLVIFSKLVLLDFASAA